MRRSVAVMLSIAAGIATVASPSGPMSPRPAAAATTVAATATAPMVAPGTAGSLASADGPTVRDFTITPVNAYRGQHVRFRFQAGVQSGDTFTPSAFAEVELRFAPSDGHWDDGIPLTTDALGRVDIDLEARRSGRWCVTSASRYLSETIYTRVTRAQPRVTSFDAGPEPVRKGRTLTVKGRLKAPPTGYETLENRWVSLWFRPKGSTTWRKMGTARINYLGVFVRTFKARADGQWRLRFAGDQYFAPLTGPADYVDVR